MKLLINIKNLKKNKKNFVFLLLLGFILSLFLFDKSHAKTKKNTVGHLLKRIEKKQQQQIQLKKRSTVISKKVIRKVKPPKKLGIHSKKGYEAQLEDLINKSIKQLYRLSIRLKRSSGRGEIWLRLAQVYIEKAKIVELRLHEKFERQTAEYINKKRYAKPKLNLKESKLYNKKAIELYLWYLRDFPKSKKVNQALFFLGYNYFQLDQRKLGEKYLSKLTRKFPKDPLAFEAYFKLGEYFFEKSQWQRASYMYKKFLKKKKSKAYFLSLYKLAWCYYKLEKYEIAFNYLYKIILFKDRLSSEVKRYQIQLTNEAIKDSVTFYAETRGYKKARAFFRSFLSPSKLEKQMEQLAHLYKNSNRTLAAHYTFLDLIRKNPLSPKAFDHQSQILSLYRASGALKEIGQQFSVWIRKFGPKSKWYRVNKQNETLVQKSISLMEEEYRFFILENHKNIQSSKNYKNAPFLIDQYKNYISKFTNSPKKDEMHFFYAELLFDLKKYKLAATHYKWVVSNAKKSPYYKKSYFNFILSLETLLPSFEEIKKMSKNKKTFNDLNKRITTFYENTKKFLVAFPKNKNRLKIEYKMALLNYHRKKFSESEKNLKSIIKKYPKSEEAAFASELILDIYQAEKKDENFDEISAFLLKHMPNLSSKIKKQIQEIQTTNAFRSIEVLDKKGKSSLLIAKKYKALTEKRINNQSLLIALFNAALHFEKAKHSLEAIKYYTKFIQEVRKKKRKQDKKTANLLKSALESRALLYEQVGLYKKAAHEFTSFSKLYKNDSKSMQFLLKASLIYDGLKLYNKAFKNYNLYYSKSPPKKKPEVLYLMGKMSQKRSHFNQALIHFDRFMKNKFSKKTEKVKVAFYLSEISEKIKRKNRALFWTQKTLSLYNSLSSKDKTNVLNFASKAEFKLAYATYLKFKQVKIAGSTQQQSAAFQKKLTLLETLKSQLKKVIDYNDSYQIVAALTVQGHALKHISKSILNSPIPKGLKPEEIKLYKKEIEKNAAPFIKNSNESYTLAKNKTLEFNVFGKWRKELMKQNQRKPSSKEKDLEDFIKNPLKHVNYSKKYKDKKIIKKREARSLIKKVRKESSNNNTLTLISKLISKDPNHFFGLNLLGIYHTLRNEDGLSKIIFERALKNVKKKKYKSILYNNLSILYVKEKDFQTALIIKGLK